MSSPYCFLLVSKLYEWDVNSRLDALVTAGQRENFNERAKRRIDVTEGSQVTSDTKTHSSYWLPKMKLETSSDSWNRRDCLFFSHCSQSPPKSQFQHSSSFQRETMGSVVIIAAVGVTMRQMRRSSGIQNRRRRLRPNIWGGTFVVHCATDGRRDQKNLQFHTISQIN